MSRPRIAVIGAGAWGMNHVRAVASDSSCELVAIVDPEPTARQRAHAFVHHANVLADSDAVLDSREVDAVIIATPSRLHASLAIRALDAGKHVLVEKPLALDLASASSVAEAAQQSSAIAMVGHLMVFHPVLERVRELLCAPDSGPLSYVHSVRANHGRCRADESVLWSLGPHELSMLEFLLGTQPVRVAAHGRSVVHPGIVDVVFATLEYAQGQLAELHLSRVHPRKQRMLELVCEYRSIRFDDVAQDKVAIYDRPAGGPASFTRFDEYLTLRQGDVFLPNLVMEEPLRRQLTHFVLCIREQRQPLTSIASSIEVVRILAAIQRSVESGGTPVDCAR